MRWKGDAGVGKFVTHRKHSYWKIQQAIRARRRWEQSRKVETLRDTVVGDVNVGCALPRVFILSSGFVIGDCEEERAYRVAVFREQR